MSIYSIEHRPSSPYSTIDTLNTKEIESLETIYNKVAIKEDFLYLVNVISDKKTGARLTTEQQTFTATTEENAREKLEQDEVYKAMTDLRIPFDAFILEVSSNVYSPRIQLSKDVELLDEFPYTNFSEIAEEKGIEFVGEFLGIPDEDNGWFEDFDEVNTYNLPHIEDCLEREVEIRDYICIQSIPYYPQPTKDGIERAINVGEQYLQTICELDKIMDSDLSESSFFYLMNMPDSDGVTPFSVPKETYDEPKRYYPC